MSKVKDGDTVKVHYTGKLENGEVFDTSREQEPFEFTVGNKAVIPGFEKGVVGIEDISKGTMCGLIPDLPDFDLFSFYQLTI